jgi:ankyrin repeat protein
LKKENKNEENLKIKKFEKRTAVNNNIFKRFPKKNSYFNLIDNFNIIEKYKILKNLIKEGKELLFIDYFNHNSKIIDKNYKDEDGNTFLILSIKYNMNNISKMLINKGININIQNNDGNSALHFALSSKNFYMADILRKFGALENSINNLGYTPWECIGKNIENDPIY